MPLDYIANSTLCRGVDDKGHHYPPLPAHKRITHPFLPTSGREIDVVGCVKHWGEERVVYLNDSGRVQSISAAFTDIGQEDDFRRIAAGRAAFRSCDLLELCRRLDALLCVLAARRV